jgi:sigma-B regulation protein RsbU (phosphoserine phosphatase)
VNDVHATHTLIAAPLRAKQRTVGVIALANSLNIAYTAADLKLLNTIALQTATAIENSLLCAEMVDAVRDREKLASLERELDTARTIQHSLLPSVCPPFPDRTDFDIHAQMQAAKAVGGDFFDFFLLDDRRLGVVIGDVSGKGTPAALFMAVAKTQVKPAALRGGAPAECILEVNRAIVRENRSSMYATCFYGILDTVSGDLSFCNAGHNPPYVLRAGGAVEALAMSGGLPIGLFDKFPYHGGTTTLGPGDTLFLFTDGVPDAVNRADEEFSDQRLMDLLSGAPADSCRGLIEYVTARHAAFAEGAPQFDDITMLAVGMRTAPTN